MYTEGLDAQFIDRSRAMLSRQADQVVPIINTYTGSRVAAISDWVGSQRRKQREPLRRFQDMSTHLAVALTASALDNTRTLTDLLDKPDGRIYVWSYLTLARATVESAVRFAYLTDCNTSPVQRILRAAAMEAEGRREEQKLIAEFEDPDFKAQTDRELEALDRRIERAGISCRLDRNKKRAIGLERDGESVSFDINMTHECSKRMSRNVAPYRIGSAVTHSAWWFLASSLPRRGNQMVPTPDPNIIINAVSLTLESLEVMATSCASSTQANAVGRLHRNTDLRMRILLKYSAAPFGVSSTTQTRP